MILRTTILLLLAAGSAVAAPLTVEVVATGDGGEEIPVRGARLVVRPATQTVWPEELLPVSVLITEEDGTLTVDRGTEAVTVVAGMALRATVARRVPVGVERVRLVLPPEAVLRGIVVGPDGRPAAGAEVLVVPEHPEDTGEFLPAGSVAVRERADGEGRFTVFRLDPRTRYRIQADAPGLARQVLRDVTPGEDPVQVALSRGATVRGVVVAAPGGEPVAGAVVTLGGARARSGDDGRFEVRGVPAGAWRLRAEAAGHVHTEDEELVLEEGGLRVGLVVRVLGTSRMTGRVLGPATGPVAGAEILLRYPPDPDLADRLPEDRVVRAGETDEDGHYDLTGLLPAQGVDLVARHPDHAPTTYLGFTLGAGRTVDSVILLREGGRIEGRVVDADGEGLAGLRVLALDDRADLSGLAAGEVPDRPTMRETVSGEAGAFRLDHVPPGRRALVAIGEGRTPAVLRGLSVADRSERSGVILFAGEGHALVGSVVGPDGKAVPGARVRIAPPVGPARSLRTDDAGRFRAGALPEGAYSLEIRAEGFAPLVLDALTVPATELTLSLERAAGVRGRVLRGESREPAKDAVVRALLRREPSPLAPDRVVFRAAGEARADPEDGTFAFADLGRGTYRFEAWTAGGEFGFVDGILVGGGETPDELVEVRVEPGQAVSGRVFRGEDGLPVEGATVALRGAGGEPGPRAAATRPDGTFRLVGVPPGFHTLLVTARDRAPVLVSNVEVRVAADTEVGDVLLREGRRVEGVVTGADGEPRIGVAVSLESTELGGARAVRTDETGRFLFLHVADGTYLVSVEDALEVPGGRREQRLVKVGEEDVFLRFGSGDGVALTGRVVSGAGPVAFAGVRLLRTDGDGDRQVLGTRTDADGNYLFPDVRPGDLILLVKIPGRATGDLRVPIRLPPGPMTIHDVYVPDSGVEGVVTDLDTGDPLGGATIVLARAAEGAEGTFLARLSREMGETSSDASGAFRFHGVPEGTYRAVAYREGYGRTEVKGVRVRPGGATPVSVAMPPAGVLTGRVVDEGERPVTNARLVFRDDSGERATRERFVEVDSSGRFRVGSLRTGVYSVEVAAPGHSRVVETGVEVFPGSVPELTVRLSREGRLEVVVYGPGGIPLEGARVEVRDFWGRTVPFPEPPAELLAPWRDPSLTDERGLVTLENLPPGLYEVEASHARLTGSPARVRVLDGEKARGAVVLLPPAPKKE